ncbi:kR domain protein [Firmicutes bacterium CAG:884]|jgi:short-subunit dehydrogenase|nr:SDR family oxidoreductase [Bacillota bacterium]CCY94539.1 kR domain protein [Firmicutes bacterium CAG:884]
MVALITGASSGIGADMARILSDKGYDLILVARNKRKMEVLAKELKTNAEIIPMDISSTYNCTELYNLVKKKNIDVLVNNAGFGLFGEFCCTKLDKELDMIELNVKTVHTLTKLFLKDFVKKDKGYILNVASSAAFMPGPLMATYYATKAYVLHLTESINEELRRKKSNVFICALCPGPVSTNFNKVAGVSFNLESLESYDVAKYAVKQMFKKKVVIIPGFKIKMGVFALRLLPRSLVRKIAYKIQKNKEN